MLFSISFAIIWFKKKINADIATIVVFVVRDLGQPYFLFHWCTDTITMLDFFCLFYCIGCLLGHNICTFHCYHGKEGRFIICFWSKKSYDSTDFLFLKTHKFIVWVMRTIHLHYYFYYNFKTYDSKINWLLPLQPPFLQS